MTVQTTTVKVFYNGDGATKNFPFTYPFKDSSWLQVIFRDGNGIETEKLLNSDYTVSGNGDSGGTVIFNVAPPSGIKVVIARTKVPKTQLVDYISNDSFPADTHEAALDKLTYIIQEVEEKAERGIRFPGSDTNDPGLAPVSIRRKKVLLFDINGDITYVGGVPNTVLGFDEAGLPSYETLPSGTPNGTFLQSGGGAVERLYQNKIRERISPEDFGAVGDGFTNDTQAFINLSAYINSLGGGTIDMGPSKTYLVGEQTFAGATGKGYSYLGKDVVSIINCTRPVIINGNGAQFKVANSLKFGSFDPVTGLSFSPTLPFTNPDYKASIGCVFVFNNNVKVTLRDVSIDGNQANFILGGQWGDTGRQIPAYGVYAVSNHNLLVENVYTHHNGADGLYIGYTGLVEGAIAKPHTLMNVVSEYNARQGLSLTGCNSFTAINCKFNYTGRGTFSSSPGAGVDIEAETGVCRNGKFINCEFAANAGNGMVADSGNTKNFSFDNCRFYGIYNYAIWPNKAAFTFTNCLIAGGAVKSYLSTTEFEKTKFIHCKFSADEIFAGVAVQFFGALADFSGQNPTFDRCSFITNNIAVKLAVTDEKPIWRDCVMLQNGATGIVQSRGTFIGKNVMTVTTASVDLNFSTFINSPTVTVTGGGTVSVPVVDNKGQTATSDYLDSLYYLGWDGGSYKKYTQTVRTAAPTTGTWNRGDIVWNNLPSASGTIGWVCVTGGTPGTWKTFGSISA